MNKLVDWVESVFKCEDTARLYTLFFRSIQISSVASVVLFFSYLKGFNLPMTQTILYTAGWVVFAEVALRLCLRGSILGFYFGAFLAIKHLFSALLPIGVFGVYALLNRKSQIHLLRDAPEWLREEFKFSRD